MSLASTLDQKHFGALLKGVGARCFFGDEITLAFLGEQVYEGSGVDAAAAEAQLLEFEKVLSQAARENWEPGAFEASLEGSGLSAEHAAQLVAWWRTNRVRVHDALRKRTRWAGSLEQLGWRIDVKGATRDTQQDVPGAAAEMSEPTAIVHMETQSDGVGGTLGFEMDREQLAAFNAQLDEIQAKIESSTKS